MQKYIKKVLNIIQIIKHWTRKRETTRPLDLKIWFFQKVIGINRKAHWPVHPISKVSGVQNIEI